LVTAKALHITDNITPTSGRGVEIFEASAGVGQVQSFNRTGSSWDELRLKGSEVGIYTGTSNSIGFYLQSTQSTLYGTSDGVLNLDSTDSGGSFMRFKQSGTTKCWVGSAEGMGGGLSGDQDDLGLRAVDKIMFSANGAERLRIDSAGRIAQSGKISTSHGSPNLLLWGADPTMMIASSQSVNNSSSVGIKFTVAGGSTGDYSKAGIFVQRQSSYNDLDMIFAFRSTNDAAGVAISDEKVRINSDGNVSIGAKSYPNWSSTVDALTIGYAGVLYEDSYTSGNDNYVILGNNTFYNATTGGNTYIRSDQAQRIMMQGGSWWFQSAGTGTAGNNITFADRFRITAGGDVGIGVANPSARLHVSGGRFMVNSDPSGAGQNYQVIQGYKDIPTSNSYVELAFVGHSHSIEVQFVIKQGSSNWIYGGANGKFNMFTTYGSTSGQQDMNQRRYAMNGGNIAGDATFDYLNSGGAGGSYLLRVAVPFSSTNAAMNISYVVKGLSSHYMYAL